jgi:hypothetical protein
VGSRAGLDRCGKSRHLLGFDPRTVQPVASRYTDYATRPTIIFCNRQKVFNVETKSRKETCAWVIVCVFIPKVRVMFLCTPGKCMGREV